MLQWLGSSASEVVYNDQIDGRFVAVVLDVRTGKQRILPRAIYTVSTDGKRALSLNFARNGALRPGYGYMGLADEWADDPQPSEDGVWVMDMLTGEHELIVSIDDAAKYKPNESMVGKLHWVNHILFRPDGQRFVFLHRWWQQEYRLGTQMFTANRDGTGLFLMPIEDASHFIWYGQNRILSWDSRCSDDTPGYYVAEDNSDKVEMMGRGVFVGDGHMTVSPDGRWVLTDEYPDEQGYRNLLLYGIADGKRVDLGRFYSPLPEQVDLRCDLHPRWNRDGTQVCIDSDHDGSRQMYVLEVSSVCGS